MSVETGGLYSILGRRISEIRKERNLSQNDLATSLSQKRTQTWVSNVESGRRNINAFDLYEIAAVFEVPVSDLFKSVPQQPASTPKGLVNILSELSAHLPSEMPIYLQRDITDPSAVPIDYQYGPIISLGSIFDRAHPLTANQNLGAVVLERYYSSPRLAPTDILTFNGAVVPHADPDEKLSDTILVKLSEPFDGLDVHPCIIRPSGDAETTLSGHDKTVFAQGSFEIFGVITLQRALFRASPRRAWLHRKYGISKDELLAD